MVSASLRAQPLDTWFSRVVILAPIATAFHPRLGDGVLSVGKSLERRGGIHRQFIRLRREFVLAIEHLIAGDDLAGMSGHAPHGRDQSRLDAALAFTVGVVV